MNFLCPNCGSQDIATNQNGLCCNDCGFSWNPNIIPNTGVLFPQNNPQDEGIVIKNVSIGKIQKSEDGSLYCIEKEAKQQINGSVSTTIKRTFVESAGIIYHSDQESVALCKCGNLVFKDEFARCAWCNKTLCGNCQKKHQTERSIASKPIGSLKQRISYIS